MSYVLLSVRCLLGAVFLASALTKVRNRRAFREFEGTVSKLGVPRGQVRAVALVVAITEASIPFLLAGPARAVTGVGLGLAVGVLGAFVAAIVHTVRRGAAVPCRCFGSSSTTPLGRRHVARNALLIAAAAAGLFGVVSGTQDALTPSGAAVAAVAGLVGAILIVMFDDVIDLVAAPSM
ncbi:MAG TPA: MauE/DoxX family redox-associated membrane protein [Acidimicrobiales bacterium]|jgi:uncharacterized membrane protein YphA (DoxX/SURF4 family)